MWLPFEAIWHCATKLELTEWIEARTRQLGALSYLAFGFVPWDDLGPHGKLLLGSLSPLLRAYDTTSFEFTGFELWRWRQGGITAGAGRRLSWVEKRRRACGRFGVSSIPHRNLITYLSVCERSAGYGLRFGKS